jgi:hypothetical protein
MMEEPNEKPAAATAAPIAYEEAVTPAFDFAAAAVVHEATAAVDAATTPPAASSNRVPTAKKASKTKPDAPRRKRSAAIIMSQREKVCIVRELRRRCEKGELPHGAITEVANLFGVTRSSASRLWKRSNEALKKKEAPKGNAQLDHVPRDNAQMDNIQTGHLQTVDARMGNLQTGNAQKDNGQVDDALEDNVLVQREDAQKATVDNDAPSKKAPKRDKKRKKRSPEEDVAEIRTLEEILKSRRCFSGRRPKYTKEDLLQRALAIPLSTRKSIRALSDNMGVSTNTVWRLMKEDLIVRVPYKGVRVLAVAGTELDIRGKVIVTNELEGIPVGYSVPTADLPQDLIPGADLPEKPDILTTNQHQISNDVEAEGSVLSV